MWTAVGLASVLVVACNADAPEVDVEAECFEGVDLRTNPQSCGECGNVCRLPGALPVCREGVCEVGSCVGPLRDCDGVAENGCETDVSVLPYCGSCTVFDPPPGAACGICGEGRLVCAGPDELACADAPGPDRLNACGGCARLPAIIGAPCGPCWASVWACDGPDGVSCVDAAPVDPTCSGPCRVYVCDAENSGVMICARRDAPGCAELQAPPALSASDGTSSRAVDLSWSAVRGAGWYRVWRDDVELDVVYGTSYRDTGASAGVVPPPELIEATTALPDRVSLRWEPVLAHSGVPHVYTVVAENLAGTSPPAEDFGFRGGEPVVGYVIELPGGAFVEVTDTAFDDTSAPATLPTAASFAAGDGSEWDAVRCRARVTASEAMEYRVSARTVDGVGPPAVVDGAWVGGDLRWRFERSETDGPAFAWRPVVEVESAVWDEPRAEGDDEPAWYRAVATDEAGREWASEPDRGWPARRDPDARVVALALGAHHSCALRSDGSGRCWGRGGEGQLVNGSLDNVGLDTPVSAGADIDFGGPMREIDAGHFTTCAWMVGGTIRCAGGPDRALLGAPPDSNHQYDIDPGGTIVGWTVGNSSQCAMLDTGAVRCWGAGDYGQLGIGSRTAVRWPDMPPSDTFGPEDGVEALFDSVAHGYCVRRGGFVQCWGQGRYGQNGTGTGEDAGTGRPVRSSGRAYILSARPFALIRGTSTCTISGPPVALRCWGRNDFGQLGVGHALSLGDSYTETAVTPRFGIDPVGFAVSAHGVCAWNSAGTVRCFGGDVAGSGVGYETTAAIGDEAHELPPRDLNLGGPVVVVVGSEHHFCALMRDGAVRCWGSNASGELGNGRGPGAIGAAPGTMPPPPVEL